MHVDFHSKEDLEAHYTVMEKQPDGPCVRLRLKSDGNIVDVFIRSWEDAQVLFHAADKTIEYFEDLP